MRARTAAALTTAALVLVAGCSGADNGAGPSGSPSTAPSASASATGTTGTSTLPSDAATTGSSPSATASPSSADPQEQPAVTGVQAGRAATRALTAARQAAGEHGKAAERDRKSGLRWPALRAAEADARLATVRGTSADKSLLDTAPPTVLAVSRGKDGPAFLVVQTEPKSSETPVLHLLRANRASGRFRIADTAAMLPGTALAPFDPLEEGSTAVAGQHPGKAEKADLAGLAVRPQKLLSDYARYLSYPHRKVKHRPFGDDHFAASVRSAAADQATAVRTQADFSQSHHVRPDSVVTVRQQDGGALVFGLIERHDDFDIKPGQTVKPTKAFQVFAPDQQKIEISARLTTFEFVVFQVPDQSGTAELVAASEHLVDGKGH